MGSCMIYNHSEVPLSMHFPYFSVLWNFWPYGNAEFMVSINNDGVLHTLKNTYGAYEVHAPSLSWSNGILTIGNEIRNLGGITVVFRKNY